MSADTILISFCIGGPSIIFFAPSGGSCNLRFCDRRRLAAPSLMEFFSFELFFWIPGIQMQFFWSRWHEELSGGRKWQHIVLRSACIHVSKTGFALIICVVSHYGRCQLAYLLLEGVKAVLGASFIDPREYKRQRDKSSGGRYISCKLWSIGVLWESILYWIYYYGIPDRFFKVSTDVVKILYYYLIACNRTHVIDTKYLVVSQRAS